MRRKFRYTVALLAPLVAALPCWADESFDKGVELYNKKDYAEAIKMFSHVQTTPEGKSKATVLYYAALCYQQLGDVMHAKMFYQMISKNYADSPEGKLATQGLAQLAAPPPVAKPAAAAPVDPAVASQKLPAADATGKEIDKFFSDYKLTDAEWKKLPNEAKVPFERATHGHLFVNGYINGRPLRMMFDTGASICSIYRKDAEVAGIKLDESGPRLRIGGVAGSTTAQVMVGEVEVGDLKRRCPMVVTDTPFGFALLGQSFFKDFKYNIDNGGGFIDFIKKPREGMASTVYESTDVLKVPFEPQGNNMLVDVKINGHLTKMIFDTGAYSVTMSAMLAPSLGISIPPDAQGTMSGGVGGRVSGVKVFVDRIELGPLVKTHVPVVLNMGFTPSLLGQPFFSDRKFTIDNDNHTINFAH